MTVPTAAGTARANKANSQMLRSEGPGGRRKTSAVMAVEKTQGQIRRGTSRPDSLAQTTIANATLALKGSTSKPETSTGRG